MARRRPVVVVVHHTRVAAKNVMVSVPHDASLETTFTILQFAVVVPLIALAYQDDVEELISKALAIFTIRNSATCPRCGNHRRALDPPHYLGSFLAEAIWRLPDHLDNMSPPR